MNFERIRIDRAPGVDQPFELANLAPGFNVIQGPNGSGKSLLCRVVRSLLWESVVSRGTVASAEVASEVGLLHVRRDEDQVLWNSATNEVAAPRMPSEHLSGCFLLHAGDLLSSAARTDREIALEIRKQMAGGYDLDAVRSERFTTKPSFGKAAQKGYTDAQLALTRVKGEFRALSEEEESLVELARRIDAARRAGDRVRVLEHVRELAQERTALALLDARLEGLPPGMDRISGAEGEKLAERDEALATRLEELDTALVTVQRRREQLADCALSGETTGLDEVAVWRDRVQELQWLEERCVDLTQKAAGAAAHLHEARGQLAGDGEVHTEAVPSGRLLSELDEHLRLALSNREALRGREGRLDALLEMEKSSSRSSSSRAIERGLEALREWCANPVAEGQLARLPLLWVLAVLLMGAGVFLGRTEEASWFALAGAGVVLGVWAYSISLAARGALALRSEARSAFPKHELQPPEEWSSTFVHERVAELEEELFAARTGERIEEERSFLTQSLDELEEEEARLEQRRRELAQRTGVDLATTELSLVETARRLAVLGEAAVRSREADAEADAVQCERHERTRALHRWLTARGYGCGDAAEGNQALRDLEERVRTTASVERELRELEERLPRFRTAVEDARLRVQRTFADAGLEAEDRLGLEKRLDELEGYKQLEQARRVHRAQIERLVKLLPEGQTELSAEAAEAGLEEVREEAQLYEGLVEKREEVRHRLESARSGTRMEDALDEEVRAKELWLEQHEVALDACLGSLLLRSVGEEYRRNSSPSVLREAVRLFGEFTQHRYELLLEEAEDETRFRARDVLHGQVLSLSELSDGTRMQLLLAARFAFALEVEEGIVPFFLDEALSFSDPERFGEIARVLFTLVAEGRQVFYLTSSPAEVDGLRRAALRGGYGAPLVHDLAVARGEGSRAIESADLEYELVPALPPVGTDSAEQYGLRIGVALPVPGSPVEALHLFHLLREELELLRSLARSGCVRVGQWEDCVRTGAAPALVSEPAKVEWLSARCKAARAVFEAWQIGRGRTIGRKELIDSGAVSERFLDGFTELLEESDGNPERFLSVLETREDPRTKNFQKKKKEELEQWLDECEALDRRLPLDRDAALRRVQSALVSESHAGSLALEEIVDLATLLWSALERGNHKRGSQRLVAKELPADEPA